MAAGRASLAIPAPPTESYNLMILMRPSVRQNRKSRPPTGIELFANGLGKIQRAFFAAVTAKIGTFFAVRVTFCDGQTEEGTDARRAGRRGPHRVGRFELEADRRKFGRELRRYPFEERGTEEEEDARRRDGLVPQAKTVQGGPKGPPILTGPVTRASQPPQRKEALRPQWTSRPGYG